MSDITIAPVDRRAIASLVLRCALCLGALWVLLAQAQKDVQAQVPHQQMSLQQEAG